MGNTINNGVITEFNNQQNEFTNFENFARLTSLETRTLSNISPDNTPVIDNQVYNYLPELLKKGCLAFDDERERDVFLTGALTTLSGCINTVKGVYRNDEVFTNLNCFIVAPPASGKGVLKYAKNICMPLHKKLQTLNSTASQGVPGNSKVKGLFVAGNSSSAAIIKHLNANQGSGIMLETEADTLNVANKQDWGNFSDMLRKAFHHEFITYSRVSNDAIEVDMPKLSIALSGTPNQIRNLIYSPEDGFFSRFMYYVYETETVWKSIVPNSVITNWTTYFENIANEVFVGINFINSINRRVIMTNLQMNRFDKYFGYQLARLTAEYNDDIKGSVLRFGLICFRIAMVLTALRAIESKSEESELVCSDEDFETAILLTDIYITHSVTMLKALPKVNKQPSRQLTLLSALPNKFKRKQAILIGETKGFQARTVDKYLSDLKLIHKIAESKEYGFYEKV